MQAHDNAYKNMFSSPEAVKQLLSGFVHEDWIERLDFSTLENINASYVTEDLKGRADDLVWRLRMRNPPPPAAAPGASTAKPKRKARVKSEWLYVYLMLEFQSTNDRHMAVRLMTYIGLLYQRLIQNGEIGRNKKLPSVFPLVLYNGQKPWTSATEIGELIDPGPDSLKAYRPQFRYFVLDEGRVPEDQLPADNIVSGIVRVERTTDPRTLVKVLTPINQVLELPQNTPVKLAFATWLNNLIIPKIALLKAQARARGEIGDDGDDPIPTTIYTVPEVQTMLSEQLDTWEKTVARQALQRGMLLGERLGEQRGIRLGEQRGIQLGEQRGIQLGEQRGIQLGEQRGIQVGEQRGKVEGILEGKFEAQSYTLRRLLSRRFGVLSPGVSAQIAAADLGQIEAWLDRVLDASSVAEVLQNH
jgi:Putative transposase, YhgA-like